MATLTYPTGVKSWGTLAAAGTTLGHVAAVLGTVGLGDGSPAVGNRHAIGVDLQFTLVAGGTTSLVLTFEVSRDGTNWYTMADSNTTFTIAANTNFRLLVHPFGMGTKNMRVSALIAGPSPLATLTLKARLTGVTSVLS